MGKDKSFEYNGGHFHPKIRRGKLQQHPKSHITKSTFLDLTGDITIHQYAEIAHEVMIFTHKHMWRHSKGLRKDIQKVVPVNLVIGEDSFIGSRAILIGVESIGKGAVVAAGSILTKNVPDYEIWAGNPAKKIGKRGEEE